MASLRLWRLGRFGAGEGDRVGAAEGAFDQPLVEVDGEFLGDGNDLDDLAAVGVGPKAAYDPDHAASSLVLPTH